MTYKNILKIFRSAKSNSKMKAIEKKYGKDYGVKVDKKFANSLKDKGYSSLGEMLFNG